MRDSVICRLLTSGRLTVFLLAAVAAAAAGDPGKRPFIVIGPDQGGPSAAAIALAQDTDGFIWVGTEMGLVRYEGGHSRVWSTGDGLPSAYISRLVAAPDGVLWVGTLKGLVRLQGGKFEVADFDGRPASESASLMALGPGGRLWAATASGLFVQTSGTHFRRQSGTPAQRIVALAADPAGGRMLLATEAGLFEIAVDGATRSAGPSDGLPSGGPTTIVVDGQGRTWAGAGRTLVRRERDATRFTDVSGLLAASLSPNSVPFADRDGSVWLPTQAGAVHVDGERVERLDAAGGLPFRWVRSILRDREGTIWVLGPGLAHMLGRGRLRNYTLSRESSGEVVWFVTRDHQGRLLVATDDGAARLEPSGLERIPSTEGHRIKALTEDRAGTIWMVSTIGPTLWLPRGATKATEAPLGEFSRGINIAVEDSRGQLWLGHTRLGILRWDPAARALRQEVGPANVGTAILGAYAFKEDAAGRLWVATSAGLMIRGLDGRWQRFGQKEGLSSEWTRGLVLLPDGSAWLHFQEPVGLMRVRVDDGRLTVLERRTTADGMRSDMIYAVATDASGSLWLTSEQGLERLSPALHVGRDDGMVSEDCAVQALLVENDRIWVGTAGGLVAYDPDPASKGEGGLPRAHVLTMRAGTKRFDAPLGALSPISASDATVEFGFAAPVYANEREVRFEARLVGIETAWREASSHQAYYPALAGGHYRFEVRAAAGRGPAGPVAAVAFEVRPVWWRTWWAAMLFVSALAATVGGFVRLRLAALARSKAALERLVAVRTGELQTRNEELSAALKNVKQLSGLLPICAHCKKLRDDKGYWNQLESYISEHSDVRFSHGICPDCMKQLYPDLQD